MEQYEIFHVFTNFDLFPVDVARRVGYRIALDRRLSVMVLFKKSVSSTDIKVTLQKVHM